MELKVKCNRMEYQVRAKTFAYDFAKVSPNLDIYCDLLVIEAEKTSVFGEDFDRRPFTSYYEACAHF